MDEETIARLLALNRQFYAEFAEHFAATRSVSDPALTSILPYLPSAARVLDVGCGNGRLALLLNQERPGSRYVGIDAVQELVDEARAEACGLKNTRTVFKVLDVTEDNWIERLPPTPRADSSEKVFDCVIALAVLHHIPGFDLRAQVLSQLAAVLAAEGHVVLSTWQFLAHERLRRKIVAWDEVGIDEHKLEPGDFLLDWKRGGRGVRYCHMVDEDEMKRLADASHLTVRKIFRGGGREGDLSLFAVLDRNR